MNPERFSELIDNQDFKKKWGLIKGKANKRIPSEFEDDVAIQPLILNTQFYWVAALPREIILSDDLKYLKIKIKFKIKYYYKK
jgi:hypothetical protein